jgi:hypothetical protein
MSDLIKEFSNTKFTLKGRIFHPNLLEAITTQNGRKIFDTMFAWIKTDPANQQAYQNIMAHIQKGMAAHQGFNPAALVMPIKDFNTYVRQDGKPNQAYLNGHYWINPSTGADYPPPVVKQVPGMGLVKMTINDKAEIYSGRNAVINISFYIMIPKAGAANQKRGFGVNVNGVLLLEGGEREGGVPTIDVNQAFGSFANDMGLAPAQNAQANNMFSQNFQQQVPQQNYQQPQQNQAPQQGQAYNPFGQQYNPNQQNQGQYNPQQGQPAQQQQTQQYNQQQQPYNPFQNGNGNNFV